MVVERLMVEVEGEVEGECEIVDEREVGMKVKELTLEADADDRTVLDELADVCSNFNVYMPTNLRYY